ncbi:hypothetical protein PPTG_21630 [Phytophthora nicotianae INRA-310]|uniref:DDE Tnp4 domain-containing protein n=1 Tax=Phytophthora nicotianae (strain INRA-310) TaxID=761204 RepID=W2QY55_PHYN3|nr:hypothetical protein PPTG_21630 [Phytophthora nicotianae INRA-310]ETN17200.1 hypothetical protein PPTG_21630 [Phytophthora nicotianae INRA-310]
MEINSSALKLFHLFDDEESDVLAVLAAYATVVQPLPAARGSSTGRSANVDREAVEGHRRLVQDYFAENAIYNAQTFRRRFRMRRSLYLRVVSAVETHDRYFQQRRDATGKLGFSALQKCTAAIRQLAYGMPADAVAEYVGIAQTTAIKSLKRFCTAVDDVFGEEYLRAPTAADVERLLAMHNKRGFVGMLGSLDCMHWAWKNCPTAWAGQYTGKESKPTIVLEAVVSRDLWFWHAFFGMPGSHIDINVLDRSDLFSRISNMTAPPCDYVINGNSYDIGYYLADGIYPPWAALVQTISNPTDNKQRHFAKSQEGARKDVERGFGVLQSRWAIVKGPARFWSHKDLCMIMKACIILHNMIVEDERGEGLPYVYDNAAPLDPSRETTSDLDHFIARHQALRSTQQHLQLKTDLVQHLWDLKGNHSI